MSLFGVSGAHSVESASARPHDVPRVFDRRPLEAVADAEVGDAALARDLGRAHHAARAAIAEPARHQDAVGAVEQLLAARLLERLGLDPADVRRAAGA